MLEGNLWVKFFILRKVDVHHVPAVGATAVLAIELCDVLERSGDKKGS